MKPLTEPLVVILSALAIISQVVLVLLLLLWLLSFVFPAARSLLNTFCEMITGRELWIAFLVALTATAGSLFFQLYANFQPCPLCWYQRYAMYPLVVILPFVALFAAGRRWVLGVVALFPVAGIIIASLHRYEEANPSAEFCSKSALCVVNWLSNTAPVGYITIPTLSLTAFVLILLMLVLAALPLNKK